VISFAGLLVRRYYRRRGISLATRRALPVVQADRYQVAAVITVPLLCLLPFVTKAFHVDDPVYIWIARQIVANPFDYYGFNVNWYGYDQPVYEMHNSPPFASYYMAAFGSIFGWSEVALHLAFVPVAICVTVGTYCLARQAGAPAVLASLACISMPAVLVSSTSVMLDTMMTGFFVLGFACWLYGLEQGRRRWLVAGAVFAGLAALTKYFGIALVPLLAACAWLREKRATTSLAVLSIPILMLAGIELYGYLRYGRFVIGNAAAFATHVRALSDTTILDKTLVGLCFAGGSVVSLLFFVPVLRDNRAGLAALAAFFVAVALLLARGRLGAFSTGVAGDMRWAFILQAAVFISAAVCLIYVVAAESLRNPSPVNITLLLWVAGAYVYATYINWGINARSYLPLAPPAAVLIARSAAVEWTRKSFRGAMVTRFAPLVPAFALSIALAYADFAWANSIRSAARHYASLVESRGATAYFQGHWGFQYYMEHAGMPCVDFESAGFEPGDVVITPLALPNVFPLPEGAHSARYEDEFAGLSWLATMSGSLGAGFYSDGLGPLPFAFGRVPPDRYVVYVVRSSGNPFQPPVSSAT
jgi:4-amino-4-deoxy-L-arabinose transferase-like glycosyltransferase